MMSPLLCERRGGDQERFSVRDVDETMKSCGGPLGTADAKPLFLTLEITMYTVLTILLGSHTGSCCRSSSSTGVSYDLTGIGSVW